MYKLRLKILLGLFAVIFGVVLVRLVQMQLVHGSEYRREASRSLEDYEFPQGMRGRILDRNGLILAEDEPCHDFCLAYPMLSGDERWRRRQIKAIAEEENLPLDHPYVEKVFEQRLEYTWALARQLAVEMQTDLDEVVRGIQRKIDRWRVGPDGRTRDVREQFMPHAVVTGLDEEQTANLRLLLNRTVGVTLRPAHRRRYPFGDVACHIIGSVGPIYREDEQRWNLTEREEPHWIRRMRHNYWSSDLIGKSGVETMAEPLLRPTRGYRRYSQPGVLAESEPAADGRDVHLTIDVELQASLTDLMRSTGSDGCIVVLQVPSGDVLAMVSCPTYDLNTYRREYLALAGRQRNEDGQLTRESRFALAHRPLMHRAIVGGYEPGSTIKPVIALAGLGASVITPATSFDCPGYVHMTEDGKKILRCWNRFGHGRLQLVEAIKQSCNVYFPRIADKLGIDLLLFWLGLFGYGEPTETGLPEEGGGFLISRDWVQSHRSGGTFWPADRWFLAVGQGKFLATPLQVAAAHATVARGGEYRSPRIALESAPPQQRRLLPISEPHVAAVREGMHKVVHDRDGTAYKHWHADKKPLGIDLCGKTGTAQSNRRGKDHAWFAGFAPYRQPMVAFAVLLEYAGSGGKQAAPVAKQTLRILQEFGYLPTE
jgi:penicillin-binding protein 2